jgi:sulfite reductase (NADPH) hemoprotein beta-component
MLATRMLPKGPGLVPEILPTSGSQAAYQAWQQTNVRPQRQREYASALVRLPLGDITAGQLRVVAALSRAYGDGGVRLAPDQNLLLRWVRIEVLRDLFRRLAVAGLARPGASTIRDVTSCPGAESCRLAVTQSRGLARGLSETLEGRADLSSLAADATIKVSGCPNGCGQHHVATLGLQGSVRKVGTRAVPQYFVMVGGRVSSEGAAFARLAAKVPARRMSAAVVRLLEWYRDTRLEGESASAFFGRAQAAEVKRLLADLETFAADEARPEDYVDLGDTQAFVPEVMEGECAT